MTGVLSRLGPRTLLIGSVFIVSWAAVVLPVQDPDYWWHLATGQWILDHGRLPGHDVFTYTVSPDRIWVDHEYLTEVLMWLVVSHLGAVGFSLIVGALTWIAILLIYARMEGGRLPYAIAGASLALGVAAAGPIFGPRPQMLTFVLSSVELLWIERYLQGRSRAINYLPLLMVAWANLHGSWVFGLVLLGVPFASEAILWIAQPENPAHRMRCRRLAIVGALSTLAILVTPNGPRLLLYPFQTQFSPAQQKLIVEWFSPDFHNLAMLPFEAMLILLMVGMILNRPRLYDLLLTLGLIVMTLQSVRQLALFVVGTTPILAWTWAGVWRDLGGRIERLRTWTAESRPNPVLALPTILVLLVVAVASFARIETGLRSQARLDQANYPIGAVAYLNTHPEVSGRMYNQYGWGGYLVYRLYPDSQHQVFVFGEAALMGDRLLYLYEDVQTIEPDWEMILDRCGVNYVVYNRGQPLDVLLSSSSQWQRVYSDHEAVIYVRVGAQPPTGTCVQ